MDDNFDEYLSFVDKNSIVKDIKMFLYSRVKKELKINLKFSKSINNIFKIFFFSV